jgi:2-polyprenyl-3-methyl-5-hydroxy-6-metoxy-1,4-benzoquinol methylase
VQFHLPIDRHQRELAARALEAAGAPFDPGDAERFRDGVRRVWARYQQERARAAPPSLLERGALAIDRLVFERRREEHIDDPALPDARRTRLVRSLDRLNRALGTYFWIFRALEGLLELTSGAGDGDVSVLDVGSGHGAFPIRLAKRGRLGKARVRVIGSDIEPAYVAAAQEAAARAGAPVEFRRVDALALDRLEERFDVIVCTQTVHHFPPEFLAELMVRARANARRGVLLFDGRRSALSIALASPGMLALSGADPLFLHDGVVSLRRMYSPAELEMLALCAPGGEAFSARNYGPAYVIAQAIIDRS